MAEAKEQGTILSDRIYRIDRISFPLFERERENSQSLRCDIAKASFPVGGGESLQHGVMLDVQGLQLGTLGLGSCGHNGIRQSDSV